TVATKMSPIDAYRRLEPPSTLMQSTSLAPLLSATRSRDSCWITTPPSSGQPRCPDLHHLVAALLHFAPVLAHRARSRTSTMRQRFCLDIGRVSAMRTRSPFLASLSSSWACNRLVRCTVLA